MHSFDHRMSLRVVASCVCLVTVALVQPKAVSAAIFLPYTSGHMDIRVGAADGELFGFWNNDQAIVNGVVNTTQRFSASEIRAVGVFDAATPPLVRPPGSQWDFLGVAAGEHIYILPSSGVPTTLPFLGFSTEDPSTSSFDEIRLSLVGMSGPSGGVFSLYTSSNGVFMNTLNGPSGSATLETSIHTHFNLAFSQLGTYDLTFQFEAINGNSVAMVGSDVFRFQIVDSVTAIPEPTSTLLLAPALLGLVARSIRRRKSLNIFTQNGLTNVQ